ncbi:hypothetical protein FH972_022088 [Carpinus fangiana]|uniref:DUF590-domain-containing protein n=1 Tax=Carpinus fangiana TaxID=176857 RepID=A0A5N6KR81_9ROSI|nr:hypothetical protein FH972_022088 [Carpinus fangiana]
MAPPQDQPGMDTNMDVDYVIVYKVDEKALASVGITTEVRNGEDNTLLIFTKLASKEHLYGEIYRSRVKDWLHGVRASQPEKEQEHSAEGSQLYPAERLRIVYQLITNPQDEGGAGITSQHGEWSNVQNIFALHDHAFNNAWLKKWARKYTLSIDDLDEIRDRFGEKVAFYFAFTQSYFTALIGIAAFGTAAWTVLGYFSPFYAIVNSLLCTCFVEYWRHQQTDLAVRWGVRGVSSIESKRHEFAPERTHKDPVTGELIEFFPSAKRIQRQALQIPFAIICALVLGSLIATCFAIEIFVGEVYNGPGKSFLVFLPTGIITTMQPLFLGLLTSMATRLTKYENYRTDADYDTAITQKIFVLNFISSYMPIMLTAFVYVPFASILVPYLDVFQLTVKPFAEKQAQMTAPKVGFQISPDRLRKQVIYFTVTAQIVNQLLEVIVPILKRRAASKYKDMKVARAKARGNTLADVAADDAPEEKAFLSRVRKEAELEVYDVTTDYREMVVQYGYLSLFSVVWPLTSVSFLVNNWIELRTDAAKICTEMQRPIPWRADSIGPWLDALGFLTWLGSITTAAIVYMFQQDTLGPGGSPESLKGWALLLTVFFSEHSYLLSRWAVRTVISKLDSPGRQKERAERYRIRRKYLEESFGEQAARIAPMAEKDAEINRRNLEDEARVSGSASQQDRFWGRQKGWHETIQVGSSLIQKHLVTDSKKAQYKSTRFIILHGDVSPGSIKLCKKAIYVSLSHSISLLFDASSCLSFPGRLFRRDPLCTAGGSF